MSTSESWPQWQLSLLLLLSAVAYICIITSIRSAMFLQINSKKKKRYLMPFLFVCFSKDFLQTSAVSYKLQHAQIQAWHLGYNSYPCPDTWFLVVLVYIWHWRGGIYQTCREPRILIKLKIQWACGLLDVTSPRVQKSYTKGNYANKKREMSDHTGEKCATICWQVNITLTL